MTASLQPSQAEADVTLTVSLDGQNLTLAWPRGRVLLDVLLDEGLAPPHSCRDGKCGVCACKLVAGEVAMISNDVLEPEDLEQGWILSCRAVAGTALVGVTFDPDNG